ncbi:NAD+ synthase, partial [Helicobacter sp. CLO-3]|uniref:NAD+ synthase n=1 Tax=Helicobacter sp. CLO-3 TaxID=211 RepID=UPI001C12B8B0
MGESKKRQAQSLNTKHFIDKSVEFLRKQYKKKGAQKLIIGLSGGVDSAVVAALCQKAVGKDVLLVCMPTSSTSARSIEDAIGFVKHFKMELEHVDISAYEAVFKEQNPSATPLQIGNFCARIRMALLYNFASTQKGIVVGTSNKSELMLGYGTIYGDMACAINPIASLSKTEVFALAKALNIPESIIKKPPTADLYEGQSDEKELGFSYSQIDPLLEAMCEKYGDFRKTKNYKN